MADAIEIQISGQVTTSALVNLRQGRPSTQAPVLRKLAAGTTLSVAALAIGEAVQGNAHWYRTADDNYLWAGGVGPLSEPEGPMPAPSGGLADGRIVRLGQTASVVDLSHNDGVLSFAEAKAAGLLGVIHKATTGATGRDDAYHDRRAAAHDAGLLWGAYHWGTAAPIDAQVDNFLNWAVPDKNTLVALDFETTVGNQMTLDGARAFCTQIFSRLNRRPVIYSGDTLKSALGLTEDAFFGAHRLWLAQYGPNPTIQRSWQSFWLWQYTDGEVGPGVKTVPGISGDSRGRLDCDYFAGSDVDLAAQWAS